MTPVSRSTWWVSLVSASLVVSTVLPGPLPVISSAHAQPAPPSAQQPQSDAVDPPARVGRLGFMDGTISYHDDQSTEWTTATLNFPITTGDALWAEQNGRAEVMVGSARVRMDGATELDVLQLDDEAVRLQVPQGTLYINLRDLQPDDSWSVLTPRGEVALLQPGEYRIEAGTTDDPTRITVLKGQAQVADQNGGAIAQGETGVLTGPAETPAFQLVRDPPPPLPQVWAERDRRIASSQSARYVAPTVTGIEDLDDHGTWREVPTYGRVWVPRDVESDWAPYRDGHWTYREPWGWTWVDDAPWGFAPTHYGRWVRVEDQWAWTPPVMVPAAPPPVYAPAVVGFVGDPGGGVDLGVAVGVGAAIGAAIGWFALGPQEVYVPPYRVSPRYARNVNITNVTNVTRITNVYNNVTVINRGGGRRDVEQRRFVNQRYATVVREQDFMRSREIRRARLDVRADRLERLRVAPVAAPPVSRAAFEQRGGRPGFDRRMGPDGRPDIADRNRRPDDPRISRTAFGGMPTLGRPDQVERRQAPGPEIRRNQQGRPIDGRPGFDRRDNDPRQTNRSGDSRRDDDRRGNDRRPDDPRRGEAARPGEGVRQGEAARQGEAQREGGSGAGAALGAGAGAAAGAGAGMLMRNRGGDDNGRPALRARGDANQRPDIGADLTREQRDAVRQQQQQRQQLRTQQDQQLHDLQARQLQERRQAGRDPQRLRELEQQQQRQRQELRQQQGQARTDMRTNQQEQQQEFVNRRNQRQEQQRAQQGQQEQQQRTQQDEMRRGQMRQQQEQQQRAQQDEMRRGQMRQQQEQQQRAQQDEMRRGQMRQQQEQQQRAQQDEMRRGQTRQQQEQQQRAAQQQTRQQQEQQQRAARQQMRQQQEQQQRAAQQQMRQQQEQQQRAAQQQMRQQQEQQQRAAQQQMRQQQEQQQRAAQQQMRQQQEQQQRAAQQQMRQQQEQQQRAAQQQMRQQQEQQRAAQQRAAQQQQQQHHRGGR